METAELCCLLALLPLVYCLLTLFHGSRESDLRLPPGPWRLPLIGSLHHLFGRTLPHRALRDLARLHGPLMLLSFGQAAPVVIASTAIAAREIMRTHDDNFSTRPLSTVLKVCTRYGAGMTFVPYGEHWRQVRKICSLELLSPRRILKFRSIREEEVARLVLAIASSSTPTPTPPAPVNLSKLLSNYMTDATVHIIIGQCFRDRDTLVRYVDEAVRLASSLTMADLFPSWRLPRVMCATTLHRAEVFVESVMEFMDRVISEHLEKRSCQGGDREEDLIDVLLRLQAEGNLEFELTTSIIKAIIFELLAGGSEAPITTLQWAMAELMRNPDVMSRAQAEVREAYKEKMKVTEEGLTNLPYLHCIIKETLRLHTPGPFVLPRECQEQCQILGYDVPKRATVVVNIWAICRDAEIWDEPEKFMPDRFEGSAIEHKGNHFEFIPFGAGRRICPGMNFALANMELALASLLFYFDWSLPEDVLPGDLDMTETMGLTARRKEDLYVCAIPFVQLP
ncbi:zealexin A1 synthase-like [Oryza glaberrima]|uniref:Cytochrome P450 n=1 Tax=Oryza glaberrima TaxID=4538 RepID=I1Q2F2_ORYGL|nr:zealexin A1 synthase-like [Oryza glaberrima]